MYKIEIWVFRRIVATYESDDIHKVLVWYIKHWSLSYDCGMCAFEVYKNGEPMSYDELYKIGFTTEVKQNV